MITVNDHVVEPTHFPDGTQQVWKLPDRVLDKRVFIIEWKFSAEHEFVTLLQLCWLLRVVRPRSTAILNIYYLPYGRQDKGVSNDSTFGLYPFMTMLIQLPLNNIVIFDPHSTHLLQYNKVSTVLPDVDKLAKDYDVVCFPDAGAAKKYNTSKPTIVGNKKREESTGKILHYEIPEIDAGSRVLVVDDICDGGATFCLLGHALRKKQVIASLYVSHGIFSRGMKGVDELLSYYDEIITTNSCDGVEDYPVTVIPAFNR